MAKKTSVRWKAIGLKEEERLTAGLVQHRWPAWSTDGRWLAVATGDDDRAWAILDRRGRLARVFGGLAGEGASFAPDGAIAFTRTLGDGTEIWLATTPAALPVRLLGGDGTRYRHPAFSPDGAQLAFVAGDRLWLLDVQSGERQALPTHEALPEGHRCGWPAFAPDGSELFFEVCSEGAGAIYALSFARHELQRVADGAHPAPLSAELILVERDGRLVAIDRCDARERVLELDDPRFTALRDPALAHGKRGKLRLAFTACVDDGSVVRRADLCAARLRGVELEADDEPNDTADEVTATP